MLHDFFFHPVTAFKGGPHGRLVFAKCVLPSVNKVYYYYFNINFWDQKIYFEISVVYEEL